MSNFYASTLRVRKDFGIRMVNDENLYFHAHFRNNVKPIPRIFEIQFNSETLENVQIPSS